MPLQHGKSDKAFSHNVEAEMHAGKPQKQAVAIAYSEKRKAQHKAHGGSIESMAGCPDCHKHDSAAIEEGKEHFAYGGYAEGGVAKDMEVEHEAKSEEHGPEEEGEEELLHGCAGELAEALERKDKGAILESLRAIMLSMKESK